MKDRIEGISFPALLHITQGGMTMAEIEGYKATLRSELCAYYEWGLSVLIEEKAMGEECLHEICQVLEDSNYMRDYRTGKDGSITAVNFTKVDD